MYFFNFLSLPLGVTKMVRHFFEILLEHFHRIFEQVYDEQFIMHIH